jgi:hypothetical protein
MVWISFGIDHLPLTIGMDDDAAANGAVATDGGCLFRSFDPEFLSIGLDG